MTPIILEDELAAKRYSYFQQRFRLEGFGSTPDLTLREPPPAYVENPADDVGITFGDDKPAEGEKSFKSSWIATYQRERCDWRMTAIASDVVE